MQEPGARNNKKNVEGSDMGRGNHRIHPLIGQRCPARRHARDWGNVTCSFFVCRGKRQLCPPRLAFKATDYLHTLVSLSQVQGEAQRDGAMSSNPISCVFASLSGQNLVVSVVVGWTACLEEL